ncbi:leucine aminopeptidase 1 [Phanerochaete sordida]|uniref:Peptide hydrolase n=1 Tax=Phanerochaete sordida TaxID=48140 RepID=A0A9P3FY09_9APHY|nr:leucine aminopeptidase 1 [Phanerochaete sordida]
MKSFAALLALATLVVASPSLLADTQTPLTKVQSAHAGYDLDLAEMRLVQVEGREPAWVSELDKINLKAQGLNFFDITETQELGATAHLRTLSKPSYDKPNASELVLPVLEKLSSDGPKENLKHFTSFRNRYYRSDTGRESQKWLLNKVSEITKEFAPKTLQEHISIQEFPHSWGQNTIITRINGTSATDDRIVIISAHQDSTNMWPFLPAPGADDDGSGSVTILESYRALISSNFRPVRPVEFHWYSAEEGGLLGSQAVAQAYESRSANVYAMSQYDMTAWVKAGTREEVGVITDYTDDSLTEFNKLLVDQYLDIPWVDTQCGYACSDHASWRKAGYPSVFTIESQFGNSNKNIHSTQDRYDISPEFSFEHMLEFSKLAVAFAIELGGWEKKE